MSERYAVLDLFSGAGGLTEGFCTDRFQHLAHVEMDINAAKTLETRLGYHSVRGTPSEEIFREYMQAKTSREEYIARLRDISLFNDNLIVKRISEYTLQDIFRQIDSTQKRIGVDGVDVVIGGPPCQAYSIIGRARDPNGMVSDLRNYLYLHYLAFLKRYRPQMFIFENVPGIGSAKNGHIYRDLERQAHRLGYEMDNRILDAADFGVLQVRKRMIIMGWKKELDFQYPEFQKVEPTGTVRDLLCDLPALEPGDGTALPQEYRSPPSDWVRKTHLRKDDDVLRNHHARGHNDRDREIYRRAIRDLQENRRLRYDQLPQELRTHKNVKSFLDRYKVVDPNGLSHSVVAHISKDGHYYIHPDLDQARSLTVREVARIQSFPDSYLFEGARREQFKQVGNAVPPMMAAGIAERVRVMLNTI